MTTSSQTIFFHFDFLSPYAYLAWHALRRLEKKRDDVRIVPRPTVLAALLGAAGQKGPAEIPAKRPYVLQDAARGAHKLELPLALPPAHPFHPLLSLRCVCAADDATKGAAITALFDVAWGGKRFGDDGIDSPGVVATALNAARLDGDALVQKASTQDVKDTLRAISDAAIADGVFGVPTMVLERDGTRTLFWGFDSLGYLEDALDGHDPAAAIDLERWRDLPATASR